MTLAQHLRLCIQQSDQIEELDDVSEWLLEEFIESYHRAHKSDLDSLREVLGGIVESTKGNPQAARDYLESIGVKLTGQTIIQGKHDRIVVGDKPDVFKKPAEWIGEELRELRADSGLKMRDLAATLGIEPTTLSDAENGLLPLKETLDYLHRTKNHVAG